jgi:nitroreductase
MNETIGLFEAIYTQRALRRLKPDPIPDELLWRVLEAGTKAPSGSNSQVWRFLVVHDPGRKRFIQQRYKKAWDQYAAANAALATERSQPPPPAELRSQLRMVRSAMHLAEHMHEAPVLLLVCMGPRPLPPPAAGQRRSPAALYASVFPAVQNILLAARGLGLGATLTTLHLLYEDEIKAEFGIPADTETVALIPLGYPEGKYGPTGRRPVDEVTYWDRWGATRVRPRG